MRDMHGRLNQKYWDNNGNIIPNYKLEFYYEIGVLCPLSHARYSLLRHNMINGSRKVFKDNEGNNISREYLEFYYENGLMSPPSAEKYEKMKESLKEFD